ncbi:MAG: hypothetical protein ACOX67_02750 [Oscillospiraceae bacterium]|jgi:hypothetical protein
MYAIRFGGIELPASTQSEVLQMAGSDSGFPTAEERRARRAERLAELRFRRMKGYPVSLAERWTAFWRT